MGTKTTKSLSQALNEMTQWPYLALPAKTHHILTDSGLFMTRDVFCTGTNSSPVAETIGLSSAGRSEDSGVTCGFQILTAPLQHISSCQAAYIYISTLHHRYIITALCMIPSSSMANYVAQPHNHHDILCIRPGNLCSSFMGECKINVFGVDVKFIKTLQVLFFWQKVE